MIINWFYLFDQSNQTNQYQMNQSQQKFFQFIISNQNQTQQFTSAYQVKLNKVSIITNHSLLISILSLTLPSLPNLMQPTNNNTVTNALQEINKKLIKTNQQYQKVFTTQQYKSQYINRKSISLLTQSIYSFTESGSIQAKQKNKQLFLTLFRTYIKNFINSHIITPLEKSTNLIDFQLILSERWKHFKHFTFNYFAILNSANHYYETAYFTMMQGGIVIGLGSDKAVFPVPVIALYTLKKLLLERYKDRIQSIVLDGIKSYRKNIKINAEHLENIIELIWSCGLGELARIRVSPGRGITFYKQEKLQFTSKIKVNQFCQQFFRQTILKKIIQQTESYYSEYVSTKLLPLFPIDQFKATLQIISKQIDFAQQFFITKQQKSAYDGKIYDILMHDLNQRLRAQGSLKTLLETYKYNSNDKYDDIKVYFDVFNSAAKISKGRMKSIIKSVQLILSEVITQQGKQINQRINKRREHIAQMLNLKKSIDKILNELCFKDISLLSARDKAFKKILDSIEAARNLADFCDFVIKECVRLKLDEEGSLEKLDDVFLLLGSVTSTDSFLLYHQELLGKRLIDTLNEPKIQYQLLVLKKLSQSLGVLSVSSHMAMIRDLQSSQQTTQKYTNLLPFSSFKFTLKIFNPSHWPQHLNRQKLCIPLPNYLLTQARTIQDIYHKQNQYRYLNWKLEKGISLFQGKFDQSGKKVRFQGENVYLMVLLLIQEEKGCKVMVGNLRYKIKGEKTKAEDKATGVTKHDPLSMVLYVLVENRLILRRNIADKFSPFSESEQIQINRAYTLPQNLPKGQQIITIRPSQQISKSLQQSSIQKSKIMKDRQKLIQAVLVKVMKHSHATGDNCVTFTQLYKAIRQHHILGGFNFSQGVVKQRLEELIARQYCVRDEEDRKVYHYVA